jgi:splicing factor 3A subunit 1
LFIARSANPAQFEDKIRDGQRSDPKFSFLNPADPYHAYYRHRTAKIARGEVEDEAAKQQQDGNGEADVAPEPIDIGVEPPAPDFILELPSISASDLWV